MIYYLISNKDASFMLQRSCNVFECKGDTSPGQRKRDNDMTAPYTITVQPGRLLSAEEFAHLPEEKGWRAELHEGRIVRVPPAKLIHDVLMGRLMVALGGFVEAQNLGICTGEQAGYNITLPDEEGETVWVPDLAFVAAGRLPPEAFKEDAPYPRLAPDLVVEVASASQSPREMRERAQRWLESGSQLVWVVWPQLQRVHVWRPGHRAPVALLGPDDMLDGGEVLPGFSYSLARLFR
jgi:Uma2 family endonuclease